MPPRTTKQSSKLPQIKKIQGKGIAALEYDNSASDDSRTVTENSDYSDHGERKKYRSIRAIDNTYNGVDRMKSIYSTQQDKELSDGEIVDSSRNVGSEKEYPSDYEGD